jgi:type IV secretory pathway VirD2 relaxase
MSRSFPASYKLEVLAEIEAATEKGQIGQILRREGLYSSLISEWRRQRDRGALEALKGKQRGPKVDRIAAENQRLREQIARLTERLGTAEELIETQGNAFAQKNVLAALGPCRHSPARATS